MLTYDLLIKKANFSCNLRIGSLGLPITSNYL